MKSTNQGSMAPLITVLDIDVHAGPEHHRTNFATKLGPRGNHALTRLAVRHLVASEERAKVPRMVSLMIVDNSDEIRRMLRSVVADVTDRIYECRDGGEACVVYAAHRPDWVLMDIAMTPMDGITATRQIVKAFPIARIVIVSQYDDVHLRNAAKEAGACGYILKDNMLEIRRFLEPPAS